MTVGSQAFSLKVHSGHSALSCNHLIILANKTAGNNVRLASIVWVRNKVAAVPVINGLGRDSQKTFLTIHGKRLVAPLKLNGAAFSIGLHRLGFVLQTEVHKLCSGFELAHRVRTGDLTPSEAT